MVKAAVFDLDGTLYDEVAAYPTAMAAATALAGDLYGISPGDFEEQNRIAMKWQFSTPLVPPGSHSRHVRFMRALEALGKPPVGALALAQRYWDAFLDAIAPRPDAAALLADLRARGVRVGLGTNMTTEMQLAKLVRIGLGDLFDFIVTSEEADSEKPEPHFFDIVAEKAGCERSEILFCGDNLELDARGSTKAGMFGVWLRTDPAKTAADAPDVPSVQSLSGIRSLLPDLFSK